MAAHDVDQAGVERQQPSALVGGRRDRPLLFPRMIDREKVLASILDPLDRAAQTSRQVGDEEVFGIELATRAEAAADVRLREVDPCLVDPEHAGERPAIEVGNLRHAPDGQALGAGIPFGEQPARLHGRRRLTSDREPVAHHERTLPQRGVDVAERRGPRVGHVALGEERRSTIDARVGWTDERGKHVVLDLDELSRIDGGGTLGRHDHRDGLARVADRVDGQRRLKVGGVRRLARLAQRNRRHAGEVGARQEGQHTRPRERAPPVDAAHARVSVRAADDDRVRHPGPDQVVDVASAADEQARILQSLDRDADELHWRGNGTIRS